MDREVDFIWHPYVGIVDGFSLVLLDKDVETDVSALVKLGASLGMTKVHRVRTQWSLIMNIL